MNDKTLSIIIKAQDKASAVFDKFGDRIAAVGRAAVTAAKVAGVALTAAIGKFVIGDGIARALNIEDAQAKLKGLGHDVQAVQGIMDSALAAVKGTAYALDEAATTAATAVAAGVKPGKELTKYLGLTADAATIAGTSMADMGRVFNKVETVQAAYNDSLLELSEKGIPIYQWLSKELGISAEAVKDLASKGEISSQQFRDAVEKNIAGAALASGETTRGAWSNLQAAMARVGAAIVEDIIPKVRDAFGGMTVWFDENSNLIVGAVGGIVSGLGGFVSKVTELGTQIWEYLSPKLQNLWTQINEHLIPALSDLWHNVIEPLIPVIGTTLVGALGLLIDAAAKVVEGFGYVYAKIKEGDPFWVALLTTLATVSTALALSAGVAAFRSAMSVITLVTIPAVIGKFAGLAALITAPIVMPAIVVGAALAALALVYNAAQRAKAAVEEAKSSASHARSVEDDAIRRIQGSKQSADWKSRKINEILGANSAAGGYASGGFTGRGGVNEVAGIVHKGEYVVPKSQVDQNTGLPMLGGQTTFNMYGNINLGDASAVDRWFTRLNAQKEMGTLGAGV